MLLQMLVDDPVWYGILIAVMLASVVLHELGHALAATWQGDPTPSSEGHLTLDPSVHMGPVALVMLLVMGMTWGSCPVDPRRFRDGRTGRALVAAAGPAVNLVLGLLMAPVVVWSASVWGGDHTVPRALMMAGALNIAMALFNLVPVPPLDGFEIGAATWIPRHIAARMQEAQWGLFLLLFLVAPRIFDMGIAMFGVMLSWALT
ncbi:MAG: site-2 protease family protein [Myxococcota bacterium]